MKREIWGGLSTNEKENIKFSDAVQTMFGNLGDARRMYLTQVQLKVIVSKMMQSTPEDDNIYRIDVAPPDKIEVLCFGMDRLDGDIQGVYSNVNELPNWMQERISVLSMLPPNTSGAHDVDGIGRRITESVYWVYAPKTDV